MTDYEILKAIDTTQQGNLFLGYIIDRIQDNNYRGIQCSQHNRLTYHYLKTLIQVVYEIAGEKSFAIHIGDDNGDRQPQAATYYKIVDAINKRTGKGTINSVKKNTFPDLARAGFLYRYNKNGEPITEKFSIGENKITQKRQNVYSVQLSPLGIKFATAETEFERRKYYTDLVDILTKNAATDLVELLSTDDQFDTISLYEFMYILSDDRNNIHYNDKLLYLTEYRRLTDAQRNRVTELLKAYCNPGRNIGTKANARDYGNWKNESQQIFGLLSNSTYFKVNDEQLILNDGTYGLFTQKAERCQRPKTEYFKYHHITKQKGYELHHIIPFKKATTQKEAQWIDDERNLIYLSAQKHAEFTATQNVNICASYKEPNLFFLQRDNIENIIKVDITKEDALLSKDRIQDIIEYNKRLINKFYGAG